MLKAVRRVFAGATGGRAAVMLLLLSLANLVVWGAAIVIFHHHTLLLGSCLLAYGFGLRHAVDADHIAAIDNVTRKLMQQGKRPLGVGLYFSIGHSTVVFGLVALIGATAVQGRLAALASWGGMFGTAISASFLLAVAVMNFSVLRALLASLRRRNGGYCEMQLDAVLAKRGFLARLFGRLFHLIDHEWQIYPVGFLFGLGFDTATEVGLLGLSAVAALNGLPPWSILMFPALFAAGMALIDTADSILMVGAYGWAFINPRRKLFYNIAITAVSVMTALAVGGLEALAVISAAIQPSGWFWDRIGLLSGTSLFGMLGYGIIGAFAALWIVSVLIYRLRRPREIALTK